MTAEKTDCEMVHHHLRNALQCIKADLMLLSREIENDVRLWRAKAHLGNVRTEAAKMQTAIDLCGLCGRGKEKGREKQ